MIDLERLTQKLEAEMSEISVDRTRATARLQRELEREEQRLQKEYQKKIQDEEKKYSSAQAELEVDFTKRVAGELLYDLERSCSILDERSRAIGVTDEDRKNAADLQNALKNIAEAEKEKVLKILKASNPNLVNAMSSQPNLAKEEIASYIAADKELCYLITPLAENGGNELYTALKQKIDGILGICEVTPSIQGQVNFGSVVKVNASKIKFELATQYKNGFAIDILKPVNGYSDMPDALKAALIDKFEILQPENFETMKLEHKVVELDEGALKCFICTPKKEFYTPVYSIDELLKTANIASIEDAAKMTGKTPGQIKRLATLGKISISDNNEVNLHSLKEYVGGKKRSGSAVPPIQSEYTAGDPDEIKKEAYARLEKCSDELSSVELAYVLGMSRPTSAVRLAGELDARKEGHALRYPKQSVMDYLGSHYMRGNIGWTKIEGEKL